MSDYYTVVGQAAGVRVLSQSQVADVQAVAIYTKPSGIYTVVQVPLQAWQQDKAADFLNPPALLIEQLMGNDLGSGGSVPTYVNGAQYVQAQDSSGLLAGFMDFTVYYQPATSVSLPNTATVRIPMTSLESFQAFEQPLPGGTPSELIKQAHAQLVKTAAS